MHDNEPFLEISMPWLDEVKTWKAWTFVAACLAVTAFFESVILLGGFFQKKSKQDDPNKSN